MKKRNLEFLIPVFILFLFSGCEALVVGGAIVGASTGTYFYTNGELKTDYNAPFDRVWTACTKTVADMRGTQVVPSKEIAQGKIAAVINDEKVQFDIAYKSKNLTMVSIRVGLLGDKLSSQLIHDKIADHLAKN